MKKINKQNGTVIQSRNNKIGQRKKRIARNYEWIKIDSVEIKSNDMCSYPQGFYLKHYEILYNYFRYLKKLGYVKVDPKFHVELKNIGNFNLKFNTIADKEIFLKLLKDNEVI